MEMAGFRDEILEENGLKCWITELLAKNRNKVLCDNWENMFSRALIM